MNFEINNLTRSRVDKGFLEKVAKKLGVKEVSLVIVGEKKIKELNRKYRKENKVTDVLAFDYGEIFICLPQAKKQAKQLGHSLKKELGILLIHGLLHLAGYKDEKKKDYDIMMREQEKICQKLIL